MKVFVASHLKDMNRQKVYDFICSKEKTSKAEISKSTNISAPTVIKIIQFMIEKELLIELGEGESALGRKPQMLELNKNRYYSIGVIHEGAYLTVGVANLAFELVAVKKVRIVDSLENALGVILFSIVAELLEENSLHIDGCLGIGIGIPGVYDTKKEDILTAPLIGIKKRTNISEIINGIKEKYNVEVCIENDLNMEVIGEFLALKLTEENDLIYLSVGTGVGCGVILNGSLRHGKNYMCGEVGYMSFSDEGKSNTEEEGWLESRINLHALNKKFLIMDYDEFEKNKHELLEYVSSYCALCINNIMLCYDCDNFSIGGEVFDLLGDSLFELIKEKVSAFNIGEIVIRRKTSEQPGVIGAAGIVTQKAIKYILEE